MYRRGALILLTSCALAAAGPAAAHTAGSRFVSVFDAVRPSVPGIEVTVENTARAPRITVRNTGTATLEITGLHEEPFARISPRDVSVNTGSPTARVRDDPLAELPRPSDDAPRWRTAGSRGELTWFDRRIEWPGTEPPADAAQAGRRTTIHSWTIRARWGEQPVELTGHVDYVPAAFDPTLPVVGGTILVFAVAVFVPKPSPRTAARLLAGAAVAALAVAATAAALRDGYAFLPGLAVAGAAVPLSWRDDRFGHLVVALLGAWVAGIGVWLTAAGAGDALAVVQIALGAGLALGGLQRFAATSRTDGSRAPRLTEPAAQAPGRTAPR